MLSPRKIVFAAIVFFGAFFAGHAIAQEKSIVVASTTSTQDSGLFDYLLPLFTQKTGIAVKVLAQGTGQALDTGRRGEADVVLVHNKSAENRFIDEGDGVKRVPVMYNDFVLIGPKSDPAGSSGSVLTHAKSSTTCRFSTTPALRKPSRNASTSNRSYTSDGEPRGRKPILTGFSSCCPFAASGHATALPRNVMNSRRLMELFH